MAEPKKTNTKERTKVDIETSTDAVPVNNVQSDEFYTLPSVSNVPAAPKEEVIKPAPEVPALPVDLTEHKTGLASNTTGGQLDQAIDRYHKLQDENVAMPANVHAKRDLLARLEVLLGEADQFVQDKIALIKAAL